MANNNKNKILNVPNLRFPEFTGEWKKVKVSDLLEFFSTNSLSWQQLGYEDGKIKNLHYGLIHKGLPTMVDISKEPLPFVKGEAPCNYTICKDGDIAFADASEDTNDVAKAIEFINCNNEDVICGLHSIHGRDKTKSTIVGYKGYAFASFAFHKQIRRITQGTKIYSIGTKNFNETYVGVPSIEEQTKIARLLFLIDERISTQNKIIEDLESLIKGIGEQITHSAHVNTMLNECLECHTSALQESDVNSQGSYPVYGANGIIGYSETYQAECDAILIIKDGSSVGSASTVSGKFSVIGTLNYLTTKVNYSLHYIYFCLKTFNFYPYKTGMAIPHIYFKDYSNAKIYCPSFEIQCTLAKGLMNIESKIKIEREYLTSLIKQKTFLLQQMFI